MAKQMKQILIIEDDRTLAKGIALALKEDTCQILQANSLNAARSIIAERRFDLLILDINLPDGSGLDFLSDLRKHSEVSVILLTANDLETDIVLGLESGADDYITKPFSLAVLRAKVKVLLRRQTKISAGQIIIDKFCFDFDAMCFSKDGEEIELSKTEQKLLNLLVKNRGHTLPRGLLIDKIWTDGAAYVDENALSVAVKRLRDKLEDEPAKPHYIKTVYRIGYCWHKE